MVLALSGFGAEPNCEEARGWKPCPELSDEFDGTALDLDKWDDFCPTFPGRRATGRIPEKCENGFVFRPENVSVANGELVLTAALDDVSKASRRDQYLRYGPYATSMIKSRARRVYGYYEIRAKTMKACVSNAFWLYDPHSDDPRVKYRLGDVSEEIDIFEVTGRPDFSGKVPSCARTYFNTLHLMGTPYVEGVVNHMPRLFPNRASKTAVDFDFCDDYHVYGFLWTPEKLVWYLDGKATFERPNDYYHRPLHLDLDSEVFPGWFGIPDPKDLPAHFRVDYVRVWECPPPRNAALVPRMKIEQLDYNWFDRHDRIVRHAKELAPGYVVIGDQVSHLWAGLDSIGGDDALPRWKRLVGNRRVLNLGFAKDRTGNVLWRIDHGELDGISPKVVVVQVGGENLVSTKYYKADSAENVAEAVLAIVAKVHEKLPNAQVVVAGLLPPNDSSLADAVRQVNRTLATEVPKTGYACCVGTGDDVPTPSGKSGELTDADYDTLVRALKALLK